MLVNRGAIRIHRFGHQFLLHRWIFEFTEISFQNEDVGFFVGPVEFHRQRKIRLAEKMKGTAHIHDGVSLSDLPYGGFCQRLRTKQQNQNNAKQDFLHVLTPFEWCRSFFNISYGVDTQR
ncbi:MAG: hypothetical protein A4E66_01967 [Syntrophus sp. PtaB.Bin001]|nr:MAG: hypothetical protein A4E66_01967 [Syntrophus sp. PtaB.Bin001]